MNLLSSVSSVHEPIYCLKLSKGYIHQGDHTPTRLKAETFRLYFIICEKEQVDMSAERPGYSCVLDVS